MKIICIRKNICSQGKKNLLFLPSNMAAVQNLYTCYKATTHTFLISDYYEFNYSLCCGLRLRGSSCSIKKLYWSYDHVFLTVNELRCQPHKADYRIIHVGGGRNRIGRREKWPKKSWEEGEIEGKSREKGENVR